MSPIVLRKPIIAETTPTEWRDLERCKADRYFPNAGGGIGREEGPRLEELR